VATQLPTSIVIPAYITDTLKKIHYFTPSQSISFFPSISASAATLINIKNARKHFEKLERVEGGHPGLTA